MQPSSIPTRSIGIPDPRRGAAELASNVFRMRIMKTRMRSCKTHNYEFFSHVPRACGIIHVFITRAVQAALDTAV